MFFKNVVLAFNDDTEKVYELFYECNIEGILKIFSDKDYKEIMMYSDNNEYLFIAKKSIEESINRWLSYGLYSSNHKIIRYSEAVITDFDNNISKTLNDYEDIYEIKYLQRNSNERIAILRRKNI